MPALGIVGDGASREEARRRAVEAIAVTLEVASDEQPADEAEYLDVQVGWPASRPSRSKTCWGFDWAS